MASALRARALGQQVGHGHHQRDGRDRQLGPVGVAERAEQPEEDGLRRLRVSPEDKEAGQRLEQGGKDHTAQNQLGGGELAPGA